jgi:hypothetical protein
VSAFVDHTEVGAYALGLLEDDDRASFEAHLAGCAQCQAEVGGLTDLGEALRGLAVDGFAAAPHPPGREDADPAAPTGSVVSPDPEGVGEFVALLRQREDTHDANAEDNFIALVRELNGVRDNSRTAAPAKNAKTAESAGAQPPARSRQHSSRPKRLARAALALAASVALIAVGLGVGATAFDDDGKNPTAQHGMLPGAAPGQPGEYFNAKNPTTGVSANVLLESKGWGTHLGLDLSGVQGPLTCRLVAVGKDGSEETAGGWTVPPSGYDPAAPLTLHGAVPTPRSEIKSLDVRTDDNRTLVSVPV